MSSSPVPSYLGKKSACLPSRTLHVINSSRVGYIGRCHAKVVVDYQATDLLVH